MQQVTRDLVERTRYNKVPQIFIKGSFIGGRTELEKLRDSGTLHKMI